MNYLIFFSSLFYLTLANADNNWWRHATIYEIFVASFKDSNGDGIGDLKGITSKLDYFVDLGVDCLHLTPFFKSSQKYSGYDITNYMDIDPIYGTMQDFHQLMQEMNKRKIKLIIDFVINHSSNKHEWFSKSEEKNGKYTDYYVWADPNGYNGGQPNLPNSWVNPFGGSSWTWNDKRKKFYLNNFHSDQPDLNLRSEALKTELKEIIKFWIDKGISGMRLVSAQYLMEDYVNRINLPQNFEVIHEFKTFVDNYTSKTGKDEYIFLADCADANDDQMKRYHGRPDYSVANFPYNFKLTGSQWYTAKEFDNRIQDWLRVVPETSVPNWMIENHDMVRTSTKYCEEYTYILTTAIMTLPGVAIVYYGQEMALGGFFPPGIDAEKSGRLPMQWDNSSNAGFTTNRQAWLPVHSNYWTLNVVDQKSRKPSPYQTFKNLQSLRKTETLKNGDLKRYTISTWIYAYVRSYSSQPSFITVINFSANQERVDLSQAISNLPKNLKVAVSTPNGGYKAGDVLTRVSGESQHIFVMRPLSSLVLTTKV